jgi:lysophospholipase L1-like esterase
MKAKLIALGDSIVKGVLLNQEFNGTTHYALADNNIVDLVAQQLHLESTNLGKMGCTIDVGERILDRHIAEFKEGGYVILSYGGNDCDYNWRAIAQDPSAEHLPKTSIGTFEKTYVRIIEKIRQKGLKPIVLSLPPIDTERYYEFFTYGFSETEKKNILTWLKDSTDTIWAGHELYNDAVKRVASATDVPLVDVSILFRDLHECLCADGIHPSRVGQANIATAIAHVII